MSTRQSRKVRCVCNTCKAEFFAYLSEINRGEGLYCSRPCYIATRTIPLEIRFKKYIGPTTPAGCILWIGKLNTHGYGMIGEGGSKGKGLSAHRYAWERANGPIANGLLVLHRCDNPPCINPDHLFLGDHADNMADKVAKGRQQKGEQCPIARLTAALVRELRKRYLAGGISYKALAAEYGFSTNAVCCAVRGVTWKHVELIN